MGRYIKTIESEVDTCDCICRDEPNIKKETSKTNIFFIIAIPIFLLASIILTVIYVETRSPVILTTICFTWPLWVISSGIYKVILGGNLVTLLRPSLLTKLALAGAVAATTQYIIEKSETSLIFICILWPVWLLTSIITLYYGGTAELFGSFVETADRGASIGFKL